MPKSNRRHISVEETGDIIRNREEAFSLCTSLKREAFDRVHRMQRRECERIGQPEQEDERHSRFRGASVRVVRVLRLRIRRSQSCDDDEL